MAGWESSPLPDPSAEELADFDLNRMQPEGAFTDTYEEQFQVEQRIFELRRALPPGRAPVLLREKHVAWLLRSLQALPRGFESFDALQGWAAFWIVHALDLLSVDIPSDTAALLVAHFSTCKDLVNGGYGGGPRQSAHLASTFSVVMALCALGTDDALRSIDVDSLARLIRRMKQPDGSFRVSDGGETDVRASYCALAVSSLVGLLEGPDAAQYTRNSASYLASLQGFDGGMGGEPGAESHGGNSYCGVASLVIIDQLDAIDAEALLDWAVMRQMGFEGGFQGRTNKLVDSCYSFWVGALFPLLATRVGGSVPTASIFDADALQKYVLECCQLENGGLRDKPGTARDYMHSCYALSGLSVAQHYGGAKYDPKNEVRKVNPLYNLTVGKFARAWGFFRQE